MISKSKSARGRSSETAANPIASLTTCGRNVVAECEEHTTWANTVLRGHCVGHPLRLVQDLRSSLADGVTLPILIRALTKQTGEDIYKPITRGDFLDRFKWCLAELNGQSVNTVGIDHTDLANGNLRAILLLVSKIRDVFDPEFQSEKDKEKFQINGDSNEELASDSGRSSGADRLLSTGMLTGVRPAGVISRRVTGHTNSRFIGGKQNLPGTISSSRQDGETPHTTTLRISSTEYDQTGVLQYGTGGNRKQMIQDLNSSPVKLNLARPLSATPVHNPSPTPTGPPRALNNAWSTNHKPNQTGVPQSTHPRSNTVEDRLKNLLSSSSSDIASKSKKDNVPLYCNSHHHGTYVNMMQHPHPIHLKPARAKSYGRPQPTDVVIYVTPYEDGEILQPPVAAPRQTTLPSNHANVTALIEEDSSYSFPSPHLAHPTPGGQRHSVNSTISSSGYVPSIASDNWTTHVGEPNLDQSNRPPSMMTAPSSHGHENYAFQSDNHLQVPAPNNNPQRVGGSSDLRAAWNRLYGQEGKVTVNKPPPPAYKHPPNVFLRNSLKPLFGSRKGPPPRPPVRLDSANRQGERSVTLATGPYITVNHVSSDQSASHALRQPIKFESTQNQGEGSVSLATGPSIQVSHHSNNHVSSNVLRQSVKFEDRHVFQNSSNPSPKLPRPENDRASTESPEFMQDRNVSRSATATDDVKMENLNRTAKINSSDNLNNPSVNPNILRSVNQNVPPNSVVKTDGSRSYEDLGILSQNGETSQSNFQSNFSTAKPSRNPGFVSNMSSHVREVTGRLPHQQLVSVGKLEMNGYDDVPLAANDSIFDTNDLSPSVDSSPSVTPPLPPLSPMDTPPESPPESPKFSRSFSADMLSTPKVPDLLTSNKPSVSVNNHPRHSERSHQNIHKNSHPGNSSKLYHSKKHKGPKNFYGSLLTGIRDSDSESFPFDIDNTTLTVEQSPRISVDTAGTTQLRDVHRKLDGLEAMYSEILSRLGAEQEYHSRERRHSIGSSDTSSFRRAPQFRHSASHKHRGKDMRSINKRFQKLESHVVTLARSVAHLSSEMKSQNSLLQEMDRLRQEVKELRNVALSNHKTAQQLPPDFERFRGWVPALTNPKRVNKLTKFFGQEPPLLEIFLRRLGYERFVTNFKTEHIGMIELPYMTEERLKTIGIPMGPRLRILQEAQLCFRQENFDIYIV